MNNELDEGCRAVIINSEAGNNGIHVIVGKYIGEVYGWRGKRRWAIDTSVISTHGDYATHMQEHQLRRIDDEELGSWEAVEALCKWKPSTEVI